MLTHTDDDTEVFSEITRKQADLHSKIINAIVNYNKLGKKKAFTLGTARSRLGLIKGYYDKYVANHERLLELQTPELAKDSYFTEKKIEEAEDAFAEAEGYLLDLLDQLSPSTSASSQNLSANVSVSHARRLQALQLKHFSGKYAQWREFRDIFTSMIIEDPDLKEVERFHYLKIALEGEAARAISNISITSGNFKRAWKILEDKYENLRPLVTTRIADFFNIKPAANESTKEFFFFKFI